MRRLVFLLLVIPIVMLLILSVGCSDSTEPKKDQVETPTFDPPGGEYDSAQLVSINSATKGAEIRYTTDRTEPTESSAIFTDPIQIYSTTTFKAKAFKAGWNVSEVAEANYNFTLPMEGLVAYYPFNGNANDGSGNGNHGTVHGATLTEDRFGNPNSAYSFNGSSDYIVITNSGNSILDLPGDFTISTWLNFSSGYGTPGYDNQIQIINKYGVAGANNAAYGIGYKYNTSKFQFTIYNSTTNPTHSNLYSNYSPPPNQWIHVVAVRNSNYLNFYIDNVLDSVLNNPTNAQVSNYNLFFGRLASSSSQFFAGKISDTRIYNRALSEAEIQALYHEGGWESN